MMATLEAAGGFSRDVSRKGVWFAAGMASWAPADNVRPKARMVPSMRLIMRLILDGVAISTRENRSARHTSYNQVCRFRT